MCHKNSCAAIKILCGRKFSLPFTLTLNKLSDVLLFTNMKLQQLELVKTNYFPQLILMKVLWLVSMCAKE